MGSSLTRNVGTRQGRHRRTWDRGPCPRSATWLVMPPGATSSWLSQGRWRARASRAAWRAGRRFAGCSGGPGPAVEAGQSLDPIEAVRHGPHGEVQPGRGHRRDAAAVEVRREGLCQRAGTATGLSERVQDVVDEVDQGRLVPGEHAAGLVPRRRACPRASGRHGQPFISDVRGCTPQRATVVSCGTPAGRGT